MLVICQPLFLLTKLSGCGLINGLLINDILKLFVGLMPIFITNILHYFIINNLETFIKMIFKRIFFIVKYSNYFIVLDYFKIDIEIL